MLDVVGWHLDVVGDCCDTIQTQWQWRTVPCILLRLLKQTGECGKHFRFIWRDISLKTMHEDKTRLAFIAQYDFSSWLSAHLTGSNDFLVSLQLVWKLSRVGSNRCTMCQVKDFTRILTTFSQGRLSNYQAMERGHERSIWIWIQFNMLYMDSDNLLRILDTHSLGVSRSILSGIKAFCDSL